MTRLGVCFTGWLAAALIFAGCGRSSPPRKDVAQLYAESEARERAAGIRRMWEVPERLAAVQGRPLSDVEAIIAQDLKSQRSEEMDVLFSDGRKTGYRVIKYSGNYTFCAVSYSARFVKATGRDLADCENEVFAGLLAMLYEQKKITFSDMIAEQLFRKHQREGEPATLYEQEYEQFLLRNPT